MKRNVEIIQKELKMNKRTPWRLFWSTGLIQRLFISTWVPSLYYVSKFLDFILTHPLCQHKYSTERQKKITIFWTAHPTNLSFWWRYIGIASYQYVDLDVLQVTSWRPSLRRGLFPKKTHTQWCERWRAQLIWHPPELYFFHIRRCVPYTRVTGVLAYFTCSVRMSAM